MTERYGEPYHPPRLAPIDMGRFAVAPRRPSGPEELRREANSAARELVEHWRREGLTLGQMARALGHRKSPATSGEVVLLAEARWSELGRARG